jgi:hypothetical protein
MRRGQRRQEALSERVPEIPNNSWHSVVRLLVGVEIVESR